jgi:biopolymer transport protein ExbD
MAQHERPKASEATVRIDMTPMIDIAFQLITFFVMLMTIAKDEAAQRIRLPIAASAAVLLDDQIPDSLSINVAHVAPAPPGPKRPTLLSWGLELDLSQPASWDYLAKQARNEANLQKLRQRERGSDWKKDGLSTTLIIRVDKEIDYSVFRRIMDVCREAGFTKFQLKASEEERERAAS